MPERLLALVDTASGEVLATISERADPGLQLGIGEPQLAADGTVLIHDHFGPPLIFFGNR